MAKHGSKKWIVRYDGKIKRSNDRTKKDYYGELKWWDSYLEAKNIVGRRGWRKYATQSFCPQCKHNFKPIKAHNDRYRAVMNELYAEWKAINAKRIEKYNRDYARWLHSDYLRKWTLAPRNPEYDYESSHAYYQTQAHRIPDLPIHDEETWLCPKCRLKHDKKDEMWYTNPHGSRENWNVGKRLSRGYYRAEVRNKMRAANKFEDYDGYDEILPRRKEYLD